MNSTARSTQLIRTADGSSSLYLPALDETYHSRHGAVQESIHVFIHSGLQALSGAHAIRALEVGFGTGLNALLTRRHAQRPVHYTTLETFPLPLETWRSLEFPGFGMHELEAMHLATWNEPNDLGDGFILEKRTMAVQELEETGMYDLVYFDAFGPRAQPEMWTPEVFHRVVNAMRPGALLVTYCSKGQVRRDMEAAGLVMEKLPGPPGKREMLRGHKP